jgi:site-specific recombinase XerD
MIARTEESIEMAKARRFSARDASNKLLQQSFINLKDGREWQAKIRREREAIRAGLDTVTEIKAMSVADYAALYIQRRENGVVIGKVHGRRRRPAVVGTWHGEAQRLRDYIIPEFGGRMLGAISTEEWEKLFEKIQSNPVREQFKKAGKTLSESTINKVRALMSRVYEDAIVQRVVARNPIRETAARDEGDPAEKSDFWNLDECSRFLAKAETHGPIFYAWAIFEMNSGARVNEILALQHKDVDLVGCFFELRKIVDIHDGFAVRERTKGKKSRIIGMNLALRSAYMMLVDSKPCPIDGERFVFEREDGRPCSYFAMRDLYKDVCAEANVRVIRVHDLRHTYASQFMMAGGSLESLKEILGHVSLTTTQRYAHFSPDYLKKQADVFEIAAPKGGARKKT